MIQRSLARQVADLQILHTRYRDIMQVITNRIDQAISGSEPKVTWLIGPSRVGKSGLIETVMERYPEIQVAGQTRIPVLRVETPSASSPHLLPIAVLEALAVPHRTSNTSTGKLTAAAREQLDLAGTKALVFDEASQLVELGAKITPYEVSEWLKALVNQAKVALVLCGVQRLKRLTEANPQLKSRSYRVIEWLPYDASQQSDWEDYVGTMRQLLRPFFSQGWILGPTEAVVAANFYLHAPGLIGGLSDAVKELARQVQDREPGVLTFDLFRQACDALEPLGHPKYPAFVQEDLSLYQLQEAYRHVLTTSEMG